MNDSVEMRSKQYSSASTKKDKVCVLSLKTTDQVSDIDSAVNDRLFTMLEMITTRRKVYLSLILETMSSDINKSYI